MPDIELDDLSRTKSPPNVLAQKSPATDTLAIWTWVAAILLLLAASCLTVFPRLLLFISESATAAESRTVLTPLESFLALHFGIWLSAIALALVINIPSEPIDISLQQQAVPVQPLLGPLTIAASISAFLAWNTISVGPLASIIFIGSLVIGLWGLWAMMFAHTSSHSKSTGADKHTSSFIFGNKSAASVIKKRWKSENKPPKL